jgi:hypothetical protein
MEFDSFDRTLTQGTTHAEATSTYVPGRAETAVCPGCALVHPWDASSSHRGQKATY